MKLSRAIKPTRLNPRLVNTMRYSIHIACVVWFSLVLYQSFTGVLMGDPVQYLLDFTGIATLNLLFLSLLISPISEYYKAAQIMQWRKTLGVYAALYALSHLSVFVAFELQFEWALVFKEIIDRPYITVGFVALCILSALLLTSFNRVKRRMGRTWQKLHNWVYVALVLGCVHFLWSIKSTEVQAIIYALIAIIILVLRKQKLKNIFK